MSRYIDAEKLKQHYSWWSEDDRKDFDDIVNQQPAADVRENIKGYWKFDGQFYYQCSECSFKAPYRYNYCPGCGAEMRD